MRHHYSSKMANVFSKKFLQETIGFGEWIVDEDGKTRLDSSLTEKLNFELWLVQLPPEFIPVARIAILRSIKKLKNTLILASLQEIKTLAIEGILREIIRMRKNGEYFKLAATPEYLVH